MTAHIIDGVAIANDLKAEFKLRVDRLIAAGTRPGLAVVIVGNDPASKVYVRNKAKACEAIGMQSFVIEMPEDTTEIDLLHQLRDLNRDHAVHGILVQLPLPKHIDKNRVIATIAPAKDVDGFGLEHLGALVTGDSPLPPCTPWGCIHLLEVSGVPIRGKHAVVLGASIIVGKPMTLMLQQRGATVTICNSKTPDISVHTKMADIVVAAIGKPKMITGAMIKPGAAVVDVGINRLPDGKLCGDCDFDSVKAVAGHLTPVPGGVGPMTIAMLLGNTVKAAERATAHQTGVFQALDTRIV